MRPLCLAGLLAVLPLAGRAAVTQPPGDDGDARLHDLVTAARLRATGFSRLARPPDPGACDDAVRDLDELARRAHDRPVGSPAERDALTVLDRRLAQAKLLAQKPGGSAELSSAFESVAEAADRFLAAHLDGRARVELVSTEGGRVNAAFGTTGTSGLSHAVVTQLPRTAPPPTPTPRPAPPPNRTGLTFAPIPTPAVPAYVTPSVDLSGLATPIPPAQRAAGAALRAATGPVLPGGFFTLPKMVTQTLTGSMGLMGAVPTKPIPGVSTLEAPKVSGLSAAPWLDYVGNRGAVGGRVDLSMEGFASATFKGRTFTDALGGREFKGMLGVEGLALNGGYTQRGTRQTASTGFTAAPKLDLQGMKFSFDAGVRTTLAEPNGGAHSYGGYVNPAVERDGLYYGFSASADRAAHPLAGKKHDSATFMLTLASRDQKVVDRVFGAVVGALFASNN